MARVSAINAVADAVLETLDVPAVRTLCKGGVSRNRHRDGAPPFISIGPCSEVPYDGMGLGYGSTVEVPIHIITGGLESDGEGRGVGIADVVMGLLDEPATLTVTGFAMPLASWVSTVSTLLQFQENAVGYDTTVTFQFSVFPV